jgi:hypothetical protein
MSRMIEMMDAYLQSKDLNVKLTEFSKYLIKNKNTMKINISFEFDTAELTKAVADMGCNNDVRLKLMKNPEELVQINASDESNKDRKRTAHYKICDQCSQEYVPSSNAQHFCFGTCKELFKEKNKNENINQDKSASGESFYKKKLQEQLQAKEEADLLASLKDHQKIDWKKAKKKKGYYPEVITL